MPVDAPPHVAIDSHHHPPAVDVDGLAVDVGGAGAAEESDQLADLFRLARPTEWDRVHNGVANGARAGDVFHAVSVRKAGTDAVDIDFVSGQLGGEDLREEDEARLRYRVGTEAGQALAAGDGADIDDAAAFALLDEGAADGLRDQERAVQVYVEHAPPLALFEVKQRDAVAPAAGSCVVHEDVDASEFAPRFVCEPIALIRLRDVDDERESPAADGLDFVRN